MNTPTPEANEQEEADRLREKYPEPETERTINGSRDWYESGHSSADFA